MYLYYQRCGPYLYPKYCSLHIYQEGNGDQTATVGQSGTGNLAEAGQMGTAGIVTISQEADASANIADIFQDTESMNGTATITQISGLYNEAWIYQYGSDDIAEITQSGSELGANFAGIGQYGTSGSAASITQDGDENRVELYQEYGTNQAAAVRQTGLLHLAEVYQMNDNKTAQITQSGSANRANVYQDWEI